MKQSNRWSDTTSLSTSWWS